MNKINLIIGIIFTNLFFSCIGLSNKNMPFNDKGLNANNIAINHFMKTNVFISDSVFMIYNFNELIEGKKRFFTELMISKYDFLLLRKEIKVGAYLDVYPNSFYEINGKLFVWHEKNKPINKETLEALAKYNKIDSSIYKWQVGLVPTDKRPLVATHDYSKKYYYFFSLVSTIKFKMFFEIIDN